MAIRSKLLVGAALAVAGGAFLQFPAVAQEDPMGPAVRDPNLDVRPVVSGLTTPVSMAFLDKDDFFVTEKSTGQVKRVQTIGDTPQVDIVLDLAVNFASERGLLGIALHPDFVSNGFTYLYWSESATGEDTDDPAAVPLLGNRVDRFTWDGLALNFDQNVVQLRAFQNDDERNRGNHDGGVIRFGPDGKLYIIIGDVGRRGQMQNLPDGPFGPGIPDDDFGGPEPDDAHLTGVILRLNDDGSAPEDNPFFDVGATLGGEVGANVQAIFAYGIRNSFGMAFDPRTRKPRPWIAENGDDAFDEINRVEPGMNGGWIQIMGPVRRIEQFKEIETSMFGMDLQQLRWPPENIADTPGDALDRLFVLPGSRYSDPEFSWKFAVAPAAIGFLDSRALGRKYHGDLFVGAARTTLAEGYLFRFNLTGKRRKIAVDDVRLKDRVADNLDKFDVTESEDLLFGSGFGIGTDLQTGPNGNLFVVSLSNGVVYEIFRARPGR